jgi:hypothetical protein
MNQSTAQLRLEQYGKDLSAFWNNFNNLELMLRIFLSRQSGLGTEEILKCLNATVGESLEENALTDWRTFGALCAAYNEHVGQKEALDFREILTLRDALAHGRVAGDDEGRLAVTKFSRPVNGKVRVEVRQLLNQAYLQRISEMLHHMCTEISRGMQPYMRP